MTTYKIIDAEQEIVEATEEVKRRIAKCQIEERKAKLLNAVAECNEMLDLFK